MDERRGAPPTYVPPNAKGEFAEVLGMGWMDRVRLFLSRPDPDTTEKMILAGFASFTPAQAYNAVETGLDILPITIKEGWLDSFVVRPWARRIIRRNWFPTKREDGTLNQDGIRYLLVGHRNDPMSGPPGILGRMQSSGSWLVSVFATPAGWAWLCWTCYWLATFLRTYSKVDDPEPITEPPFPDPIRHAIVGKPKA